MTLPTIVRWVASILNSVIDTSLVALGCENFQNAGADEINLLAAREASSPSYPGLRCSRAFGMAIANIYLRALALLQNLKLYNLNPGVTTEWQTRCRSQSSLFFQQ